MKNSLPVQTAFKKSHPGRLLLPGCAVAAGLLSVRPAYAETAPPAKMAKASGATLSLVLGKVISLPIPEGTTYEIESGKEFVTASVENGSLALKAVSVGTVRIRVDAPGKKAQFTNLRLLDAVTAYVERRAQAQIVESAPAPATAPADAVIGAPPLPALAPVEPATAAPPDITPVAPVAPVEPAPAPVAASPAVDPVPAPPVNLNATIVEGAGSPALPPINRIQESTVPAAPAAPRLSPAVPAGSRATRSSGVNYRTTPRLPQGLNTSNPRSAVPVTQGLARLLTFPSNILAVFFSDPTVMDARAINARTIAVTGIGPGPSTLAVFTQRYPGDAVGQANIYRVQVAPKAGGNAGPIDTRSPAEVQAEIESALNDPRIRVSVISVPGGGLAARLAGAVRSEAEVKGAVDTAAFFVPRVISSLYWDVNAQSVEQAQQARFTSREVTDAELQDNLRRITSNSSLELIALPNSYVVKGEANSVQEAQSILRLLPSLNREVTPFIVVRGIENSENPAYGQAVPSLRGEDRTLSERLQTATGIYSVFVSRSSSNGLAIYGSVRSRGEYEAVRRYALTMAQISTPIATQGTSQGGQNVQPTGIEGRMAAYAPESGYAYPLGIQLFVKILDPNQSTIRQVTISTDIVEINRNDIKDLGIQYGTAQLLSQTVTPATPGTAFTPPTPESTTRTINPAFNEGSFLGGNGLVGGEGFGLVDIFRARLTALYKKGNARVLSRPNVTAAEGNLATITIGGRRPVPRAVSVGAGAVGQDVEFRRFGIILTMRPTVTEDNSIILQIRADITQPDPTTAIVLAGAVIPGETIRSVDTTLTVRPGDILVLGGLLTNERRMSTSRVPVLADIPIIGSLFQSRRFENNETELAIFMSPQITQIRGTVESMSQVARSQAWPALPSGNELNPLIINDSTN